MIAEMAKHYMVSVEELMFCDLSEIGTITVDNNAFGKNIDIVLPIVLSEEAMKNEHFKKAYKYHREFYDELHKISMNSIDHIDVSVGNVYAARFLKYSMDSMGLSSQTVDDK